MTLFKLNFGLAALPDETPEQAEARLHKVIKAGCAALQITSFDYGYESHGRHEYEATKVVDFGS